MFQRIRNLIKSLRPYTPLIQVTIERSALVHNYHEFERVYGKAVAPVLKSNAYGHGLVEVARILAPLSPTFVIVDSYFEALTLRHHGIKTPLLIIGYTPTDTILSNTLSAITFTCISLDGLQDLKERATRKITIHLKVDTGMSRQGILQSELEHALSLIKNNHHISVEGICSHFAEADTAQGAAFTRMQIDRWNTLVAMIRKQLPTIKYWHTSATAGQFYTQSIDANINRLGLGLYGISQQAPVDDTVRLRPAMQVHTVISSVKHIKVGDTVGYGRTFTAEHAMKMATIPMGYFEGLDRRLSNKGSVQLRTTTVPIIGRVSMNITCIDVTACTDVRIGDPVTVVSNKPRDPNSIQSIASLCGTIPYEIAVHIESRLQRMVI